MSESTDLIELEIEEKMEQTLAALHREFITIRTGRANPKMVERVTIDYYGAPSPINQIASVQCPEANQIYIKPYDKSVVSKVEKAILAANLGSTPVNDGNGLRMIFPPMTEERRKESVKFILKIAEEKKTAIRNVRREGISDIKKLEKDKQLTEDDSVFYQGVLQKLTDKYIEKIDQAAAEKETDVMHI